MGAEGCRDDDEDDEPASAGPGRPHGPWLPCCLPACAIGSDADQSNGLRNVYLRDRVYGSTQQRITVRSARLELVVKEIL